MFDLALNFFVAMLAVANPVGKIPVWVQAVGDEDDGVRWRLAVLVTLAGGAVLIAGLVFGRGALQLFQIDLASFRVGGGIVLVMIGLQMIRGDLVDVTSRNDDERPLTEHVQRRFRQIFVPMSFPLIAGPGSITTVIIYSSRAETWTTAGLLAFSLCGVLGLTLIVLLFGPRVRRWVGSVSLEVVTRVFGLILVAIAVQFILEGVGEVFPAWLGDTSPIADDVEQNAADSEPN